MKTNSGNLTPTGRNNQMKERNFLNFNFFLPAFLEVLLPLTSRPLDNRLKAGTGLSSRASFSVNRGPVVLFSCHCFIFLLNAPSAYKFSLFPRAVHRAW